MKISEKGMVFFASIVDLSRTVSPNRKYLVKVKEKWVKLKFKDQSKVPVGSIPMLPFEMACQILKANGFTGICYIYFDSTGLHEITIRYQWEKLQAAATTLDGMFEAATKNSEKFLISIENKKEIARERQRSLENAELVILTRKG